MEPRRPALPAGSPRCFACDTGKRWFHPADCDGDPAFASRAGSPRFESLASQETLPPSCPGGVMMGKMRRNRPKTGSESAPGRRLGIRFSPFIPPERGKCLTEADRGEPPPSKWSIPTLWDKQVMPCPRCWPLGPRKSRLGNLPIESVGLDGVAWSPASRTSRLPGPAMAEAPQAQRGVGGTLVPRPSECRLPTSDPL